MQMKPKAYSYIRISSKRQEAGDGLERQLGKARAYAAKHDLDLDEELQDVGSGYHGKHVKFGALGGFLRLVENGKIPVGSTLIVESLDRLSREDVLTAQGQFIDILQAGITIVTLIDKQVYHKDRDDMQLIMSLSYMMRANNESSEKSVRATDAHRKRKMDALNGKARYNHHLGHWIDQTRIDETKTYSFTLNAHAATIQRIYEMADSGLGTHSIARVLNRTETPVFRPAINKLNQWRDATVGLILRDETVIGTYHVYETVGGVRTALGSPIPNYYPAAISEELFWRVQRKRPPHPSRGRIGTRYANLFNKNTSCSKCGHRLKMYVGSAKQPTRYLTCGQRVLTGGLVCNSETKMFRYDDLEKSVLEYVTDFHAAASDAMQTGSPDVGRLQKQLKVERGHLSEWERRRANSQASVQEEDDPIERAEYRKQAKAAREKVEQYAAHVKEIEASIREADDKRKTLTTVTEQIQLDRLSWTTGSDEEVLMSRARVARSLRQFISTVEVDFDAQTATVWVGGFIAGYRFNKVGELIDSFNVLKHFQKFAIQQTYSIIRNGKMVKTNIPAPSTSFSSPLSLDQMAVLLREKGWSDDQIARSISAAQQIIEAA